MDKPTENQQIAPPRRDCGGSGRKRTVKGADDNTPCYTLEELIDRYISEGCTQSHEEGLRELEDITDFICGEKNTQKAPSGPPYEYEFDIHQWSLQFPSKTHAVNDFAVALKDIHNIKFADFEQLYDYVDSKKVKFIGDTTVYDFALRYGINQNPPIVPKDYVYIHSKPLESAKHLVKLGYLPRAEHKLSLESYSVLLRGGLTAADVEHFLCVFKDEIKRVFPKNQESK